MFFGLEPREGWGRTEKGVCGRQGGGHTGCRLLLSADGRWRPKCLSSGRRPPAGAGADLPLLQASVSSAITGGWRGRYEHSSPQGSSPRVILPEGKALPWLEEASIWRDQEHLQSRTNQGGVTQTGDPGSGLGGGGSTYIRGASASRRWDISLHLTY